MATTIRFDNGDIEIDDTGGQVLITGAEKTAQAILHELFLPYDAIEDRGNEMFKADGSLVSIVGTTAAGTAAIRTYIRSAIRRLQRVQQKNSKTSRSELIQSVKSLVVRPLNDDVTSYGFFLTVVVDDEDIGVARKIRMNHIGNTTKPLVGGYDA